MENPYKSINKSSASNLGLDTLNTLQKNNPYQSRNDNMRGI